MKINKKFSSIKLFLARKDANTAEGNTNRGLWWIAAILAVAIVGGAAYFIIGNMTSQAQNSASSVTTSLSSQAGLTSLSKAAEAGTATVGNSSVGSGGFAAP